MKKSLSLLLAFAMVFTMFSSLALAETAETVSAELDAAAKFEALVEKEIFSGFEDGSARLDEDMTRAQAAVIVSLLFQLDISNPPAAPSFKDLPATHWAYDYVEAATAAGIISGHGDGTFEPGVTKDGEIVSGQVTIEQLATMLVIGFVNEFGYEIDEDATVEGASGWAQKYVAAAVELGFLSESEDYTANASRELLVEAVYEAEALAAIEIPIRDLAIEEIVIKSASEIEVTFSNEDVATYELDPALEANTATEVTIVHEETGKVFTVTLTLEVNAEIASATALSNTVVAVTLTEEVSAVAASEFSIDGLEVNSAKLVDAKTVNLHTSKQKTGELYEVKAGNSVAEFVGGLEDTTAPKLRSALALTNTSVRVTFDNEDLDVDSALNPANYVINNDLEVSSAVWGDNKSEVVLTTTEQKSGTLYEVKVSNVSDVSGNTISSNSTVRFGGKAKDTTKPVVRSVSAYEGNKVEVHFTEAETLDPVTALDINNYTINNDLEVLSAEFKKDTNKIGQSPVVVLTTSSQKVGTLYKLTVKNVSDAAGNVINTVDRNFGGSPARTAKLSLNSTAVAETNTSVKLTFDYDVEKESAENIANYEINDLDVTAAKADGRTVTLTTSSQTAGKLYTVKVSNILDRVGNELHSSNNQAKFGGRAADTTAPKISSVNAVGRNTVTVVFNEKVTKASAQKLSNYFIEGLGYPIKASLASNGTTVTLTTATQSSQMYTLTVNNVQDLSGNAIASNSEARFSGIGSALGKVKVETAYALDKYTVRVFFNQELDQASAETSGNYVYSNGKLNGKSPTNAKLSSNGKEVTLTFSPGSNNEMDSSEIYKLTVSNVTGKYGAVLDTDADEAEFAGVDHGKQDIVADWVNVIDNRTIEVHFSDNVSGTVAPGAFRIYENESDIAGTPSGGIQGTSVHSVKDNKVIIGLNNAMSENTVYYLNIHTGHGLRDTSGLFDIVKIDTGAGKSEAAFATGSVEAPKLKVDAAVMANKNTIEVYFNHDLRTGTAFNVTTSGAVTIKKGDTTIPVTFKAHAPISGNKLTLYFTGGNITSGDVLSVEFGTVANLQYKYQAINLSASDAADRKAEFAAVDNEKDEPVLLSAQAVANDKVLLRFSEKVINLNTSDVKVYNGSSVIDATYLTFGSTAGAIDSLLVTVNVGEFAAGVTYDVAIAHGASATDQAGIKSLKKSESGDVKKNGVSFTGVGSKPAAPSVATVTAGTSVTGAADAALPGAEVIVSKGGTVIGQATVAGNGSYSVTTSALAADDVIEVVVRDGALNTSSATSVTVQ